ncbi:tRNA-2-methylthio-N(6)-dimethylallyladenosine synthase [Corynebacterium striatum]|uniref:tRNA-2-methylthio-N(6)-dimethylallyladenosine synthase n=3 Tax=Corynebacterium striatum TaxID=43770 RepID=A0ABC9ZNS8_CORST|nr:tRNA (N6-isopentenyl adenosine(37)-C2)-methylthiotransferase MiaB [Corynebacterium striatum]GEA43526.1 tRNA-2-methylthio-N(6)-dimethylallyladenosine synthase [Corynebacterium striatum]
MSAPMNTRNPKNAVTGVDPEVSLGQIAQSAGTNPDGSARTYEVRTFGCQMNVHDSERISGLLEEAGYVAAAEEQEPDLIVFNTCAVRENADKRLYGTLGALKKTKENHPGMQIAVGGCLAQKDKDTVLDNAPWVDAVFGTHNMAALPTLLERARHNDEAQVEIVDSLEAFPSVLPAKRESAYAGWVSVSVGCNNTCTFCIVPSLRGKEEDRRPGDILAEVQALVDQGVSEVTLLGQNVNAYGVNFADPDLPRDKFAFSKLLREVGKIEGLERLRFTSPHPAEFTSDVIDAMAETPAVCPQLHMPLQSGSDRILKEMRRSYRSKKFLAILDEVREKMPHAAITTDIIVGFPGETEEDFEATMDVVKRARFASAFTFQYSPRPGTPAAEMEQQVPKHIVQERFERLVALQDSIQAEENAKLIGTDAELLVQAEGGRKAGETHRLTGRSRDGRLVHFAPVLVDAAGTRTEITADIRPGDVVHTTVTDAGSFFLVADSGVTSHRRTKAGDMSAAGQTPTTAPIGVGLGLPQIGKPARQQDDACGC